MNVDWEHLELVHLFWPAIALVALMAWRELGQVSSLEAFVSQTMQKRLVSSLSVGARVARMVLVFGTMAFGILALMRPQVPGVSHEVRGGRVSADIVVALDVSRSMLAEDAAPNRLARAKTEITKMVDKLAGHRVSLVAFAGKATILSPLTSDYGFFRLMLRGASPSSVSRGGTAIGEAIRTSLDAFDEDGGSASRLILLITDGEDHESYPEDAAKAAAEAGVRIVAVGLGSTEGSQIVITDPRTGVPTVVEDKDGNPVISRVDGELLQKISAELTRGAYVPAEVAALDLQAIVDEHIEPMVEEAYIESTRPVPTERFQIAVALSLLCLLGAALVSVAPARRS